MDEGNNYSDKYSNKDLTGQTLVDALDLNGLRIKGLCLSQEKWREDAFPADMTGVTFEYCNLDNCHVPEGNTLIECSNRYFEAQNDLNDWELDENGIPTNILNAHFFYKFRLPFPNPADIPDEPVERPIDYESAALGNKWL